MEGTETFGVAEGVEITVLVDNQADLLVRSTDAVKRFNKSPLLAEHGFAALVELRDAGIRILWDAGVSRIALLENANRMKIDLATVDKIGLSHGHHDHYAAMVDVIRLMAHRPEPREWDRDATIEEIKQWVEGRKVPVVSHPAAFRERWGIDKHGKKHGPQLAPRAEWEAAGAEIIECESPYRLGPGCWTTGTIPRRSFEKAGTPASRVYRVGHEFVPDHLEDDQAMVINVEGKGLVILTGCAHAGVINTVRYAQELSGIDRVWAILGGFHLAPANDEEIQRTIDEIKALQPAMVVPSHCTGFPAIRAFSTQMAGAFVMGVVGTRYRF